MGEISQLASRLTASRRFRCCAVLPLHSGVSPQEQRAALRPAPDGGFVCACHDKPQSQFELDGGPDCPRLAVSAQRAAAHYMLPTAPVYLLPTTTIAHDLLPVALLVVRPPTLSHS